MKIVSNANNVKKAALLRGAWSKIDQNWQLAILSHVEEPCFVHEPSQYEIEKKKGEIAWVYHPIQVPAGFSSTMLESEMAFLRVNKSKYQLHCRWYFEINFVSPEAYFRKHFVRALGAAVYLRNKKLRKTVVEVTRRWGNDPIAAELFFVDTFYKWWLWDHENFDNDKYELAAGYFGQIIARAPSYL